MAQNIYIDESGSITKDYADKFPYFVISMVHVFDKQKLKRVFKRFISSNLKALKKADKKGKMFDSAGKFRELKGCCMTRELKEKFLDFFSINPLFEVFYIKLDNHKLSQTLCSNKARCFNYLLKSAVAYYISNGILPVDSYAFHIDERNIRTEAKYTLEDYLNTELLFNTVLNDTVSVTYYDSCNNIIIQIADVFANIFYSNLMCGSYKKKLNSIRQKNIIRKIFTFPVN